MYPINFFTICPSNCRVFLWTNHLFVHSPILPYTVALVGDAASGWILLDYGPVIVHIMTPQMRGFYKVSSYHNKLEEHTDIFINTSYLFLWLKHS